MGSNAEYHPTAQSYDDALATLEELQKEASHGSESTDKMTKPMRDALAGSVAAGGAAIDLLALALLAGGTTVGPYPKHMAEKSRHQLVERFKRIGSDYEMFKDNFASARERLEKWKAEAEEFGKKQLEQK